MRKLFEAENLDLSPVILYAGKWRRLAMSGNKKGRGPEMRRSGPKLRPTGDEEWNEQVVFLLWSFTKVEQCACGRSSLAVERMCGGTGGSKT